MPPSADLMRAAFQVNLSSMRKMLSVFITFILFAGSLCADLVYMDDGEVIEGTITVAGIDTIILETENGFQELNRRFIKKIVRRTPDNQAGEKTQTAVPESKDNGSPSEESLLKARSDIRAARFERIDSRTESVFRISGDLGGKHTASTTIDVYGGGSLRGTSSQETNIGISLTGEALGYLNDHVGGGMGISYQLPRKFADYDGNFNFVPVYALVKLRTRPPRTASTYFYGVGQLGYGFFFGDTAYKGSSGSLSGGLYYGIGFGGMIGRLNIELLHSVNKGSYKDAGYVYMNGNYYYATLKSDIEYTKTALSIGLNFQ